LRRRARGQPVTDTKAAQPLASPIEFARTNSEILSAVASWGPAERSAYCESYCRAYRRFSAQRPWWRRLLGL